MPILLPERVDRIDFIDRLRHSGIQTSIHYPPIHQFSYHRHLYPRLSLPQTELAAAREVTLPLFSSMSDDQTSLVIESVKKTLKRQI